MKRCLATLLAALLVAPSMLADEDEERSLARRLLKGGADALHYPYLLEGGELDIDARDEKGRTGLTLAILNGDPQLLEIYLLAGANPNIRDRAQRTALHIAAASQQVDVMEKLRRAGAIDALGRNGWPAEVLWMNASAVPIEPISWEHGLSFVLPKSFSLYCPEAPPESHIACDELTEIRVEFHVRPLDWLDKIWLRLPWTTESPPSLAEMPTESGRSHFRVAGIKGDWKIIVEATGPEVWRAETSWLAKLVWPTVEVKD